MQVFFFFLKERTPPVLCTLQQFAFRHIFTYNEQSKYLLWTLAQQGAADPLDGSIAHKNLRETSLVK